VAPHRTIDRVASLIRARADSTQTADRLRLTLLRGVGPHYIRAVGPVVLEKVLAGSWGLNMVLVPLPGSGLLVHSPTWLGDDTFDRVAALGDPAILFAPNHFHHLSLARFRARWPRAVAVASETAIPRLRAKGHDGIVPVDAVADLLPVGARWLPCAGPRAGEAFLSLDDHGQRTWIVSDAFFNVARPVTGVTGLALRALRSTGGLRIGSTFLWLALRDARAYRSWITGALEREVPTRMLFSHGVAAEGADLAQRLARLVAARV
jgi:hypothetical protein